MGDPTKPGNAWKKAPGGRAGTAALQLSPKSI
jgi:hypothetical protein